MGKRRPARWRRRSLPYYTHSCPTCGETFGSNTGLWMHLAKTNHGEERRAMSIAKRSRSKIFRGYESSSLPSSDIEDMKQSYFMEYDDREDCNFGNDNDNILRESGEVSNCHDNCHDRRLSSMPSKHSGYHDVFVGAGKSYGRGENTFSRMWNADKHCQRREKISYYPFSCKTDFDVAKWIMESPLPTEKVDELLDLNYITTRPLSFSKPAQLRELVEMLPSPPPWRQRVLHVPGSSTKRPLTLLYRDGLECFEFLFGNPLYFGHCDVAPKRVWTDEERKERLFTEMMTGDMAWDIQESLDDQTETLGLVILSSDKTHLTTTQGDKECHAVYMTIGNIHRKFRMKARDGCWMMIGQIPVAKFCETQYQTMLSARLYHISMDVITARMKTCSENPMIMVDPGGQKRLTRTVLAAFMGDYVEQQTVSCTSGNSAPMSFATLETFGNGTLHPLRTRERTLRAIGELIDAVDPYDLRAFQKRARSAGMNGVHEPFWRDWKFADPSKFLAPDALHQWHKFFQDHPFQWALTLIGAREFDKRISVLQPRIGQRHFTEGVSRFKQHTQKETKDIERVILGILTGHPNVSRDSSRAFRALLDFVYTAQYDSHSSETLKLLDSYLKAFHKYKRGLSKAGVRDGQMTKGKFNIKKLEQATHVTRCIRNLGSVMQFTCEQTEKAHISHCKETYRRTNRRGYESQMCRRLDNLLRLKTFPIIIAWRNIEEELKSRAIAASSVVSFDELQAELMLKLSAKFLHDPISDKSSSDRAVVAESSTWIMPLKANIRDARIYEIEKGHAVPSFRRDLEHYFLVGTRHGSLPFNTLAVWWKIRVQLRDPQDDKTPLKPMTVEACPSDVSSGRQARFNFVLVKGDPLDSGVQGIVGNHFIGQLRVIFRPNFYTRAATKPDILAYVHIFEPAAGSIGRPSDRPGTIAHLPDDGIEMFRVKPHIEADGSRAGVVVKMEDIWLPVEMIPKFGSQCPYSWTEYSAVELASELYLNPFSDKTIYQLVY